MHFCSSLSLFASALMFSDIRSMLLRPIKPLPSRDSRPSTVPIRPTYEPIAVEALGVFNSSTRLLLNELGKRISANSRRDQRGQLFIPAGLGVGAAF